ncbi:MAG TPA: hypothetical protein VLQ92_02740, partial [Candidatus Limnocylindrales bacterium]|nr:hypothetical protein [Candidatus Limnocylindrales bacterium]
LRTANLLPDPARCLWSPVGGGPAALHWRDRGMVYCDAPLSIPLDVPWAWLAVVVIAIPLAAGLRFLAFTRSRVPLPRR